MNFSKTLSLVTLLTFIVGGSVFAVASCIGPQISLSTASASVGGSVTVTGRFFTDGCHDVGINGVFPPTYPAKGVKILFVQGSKTQEIGRVDANKDFEISVTVKVPGGATAGAAEIVAETLYEDSACSIYG